MPEAVNRMSWSSKLAVSLALAQTERAQLAADLSVCVANARTDLATQRLSRPGNKGSGRFEQRQGLRRRSRWGPGGRAQMREDLLDHAGIGDGGDDLQAPAKMHAAFDVDVEHALGQTRPAHARGR
jgi:hypothetical protein